MKKIIKQISIILLIMLIGTTFSVVNQVFAASVSCATTVDQGKDIVVSVKGLPDGYETYSYNVQVTFADGTSTSSVSLLYDSTRDAAEPTATFKATVAGTATVTISKLKVMRFDSMATMDVPQTLTQKVIIKDTTPKPPAENTQKPVENTSKPVTNTQKPVENTTKPVENTSKPPVETPKNEAKNEVKNTAKNEVKNTVKNEVKDDEVVMPKFKDVDETVYATKKCNVRSSCSTKTNNNKVGSLLEGEQLKRTGVTTEWSRVIYNGKTAYVATSLLTTEEPVEETNEVANEVTNMVDAELADIKQNVGVLPEVGNNIAVSLYFVITAIAVAIVSGSLYYKNKK